jgi:hypothetical protein
MYVSMCLCVCVCVWCVRVHVYVCVYVCEDTSAQHNSIHLPEKIHSCPFALICTISVLCECCTLIPFVCTSAVHSLYEITCDRMGKQLLNKRKKSIHNESQWSNEGILHYKIAANVLLPGLQLSNIHNMSIWPLKPLK